VQLGEKIPFILFMFLIKMIFSPDRNGIFPCSLALRQETKEILNNNGNKNTTKVELAIS
jgi:hypothetical protein